MAKKSTASMEVVQVGTMARVEPPKSLTKIEAELWRKVVATKPAEWFQDDSLPLLIGYVRCIAAADDLTRDIAKARKAKDIGELKTYYALRNQEERRAAVLATKLRLTQQSRYDKLKASRQDLKAGQQRPWQFGNAS